MHRSELLLAVRQHVEVAASRLDKARFSQEGAYAIAFIGRLDGVINLGGENGLIDIKSTIVNDRGPGAAEKKYGADFALVFEGWFKNETIRKAVLSQAKNNKIEDIGNQETIRLMGQCSLMAKRTDSYVVMESPESKYGIPTVRIGNPENSRWSDYSIPFHEYIVDKLIACKHGDRREKFIDAVSDSGLSKLGVVTRGLVYEPDPPSYSNGM